MTSDAGVLVGRLRGEPCAGDNCGNLIYRARRRPEGTCRHFGHGLCGRCYNRYLRGTLGFDEIAVERAINGQRPAHMTTAERRAALAELDSRGLSAGEIAERVGCTKRTVVRYRAKFRAEGVAA